MNILVFDIETVPDVNSARRLNDFASLTDDECYLALKKLRRQETDGNDFMPHYLQQIVAISVVLYNNKQLKVWSLGDITTNEQGLLQRFFEGLDKFTPTLVSWNGSGFDLPVMHYRSLLHGISAPRYWDTGADDQSFKWNNYLNRYHERHLDLMDTLSGYQTRAWASLDTLATLLGFPGKLGMEGNKVLDYYQRGDIASIRDYCETDVLNTFLLYLRFQLIRGRLLKTAYEVECQRLRDYLMQENKPYTLAFLENWHD